jgi:hypothetical protein
VHGGLCQIVVGLQESLWSPVRQAMVDRKDLNLVPPLVEAGHGDTLLKAGQQLFTTWSPANNSLAIAVTSAVCPHGQNDPH